MSGLRAAIQHQVHGLVGFGTGEVDFDSPRGDPGLFGPDSVTWRVHGDFTSMMIGGIAALYLQMLHPGALAGVWDHSDFRSNMLGRLRRTAQFVSGTTYASREQAERLIRRVRAIHDHVHGHLPDGTPYSANDPALLTFVHVAEATSFLAAFLRYRDPQLSFADQDRYFAEVAVIAEHLGATRVPVTRSGADACMREFRPDLRVDERTRAVADALRSQPAPSLLLGPFREVAMEAGVDLLPRWAAQMHGLGMSRPRRHAVRAGVASIGTLARWAMQDGSAVRARRRTGVERR